MTKMIIFGLKGWAESNSTSQLMRLSSGSLRIHGLALGGFKVTCVVFAKQRPFKEKPTCKFSVEEDGTITSFSSNIYILEARFIQLLQTLHSSKETMDKLTATITLGDKLDEYKFYIDSFDFSYKTGSQS